MPAILPSLNIESAVDLAKYFMPHQLNWIQAEDIIHAQNKQAHALVEKSVRISWTCAESFPWGRVALRWAAAAHALTSTDHQLPNHRPTQSILVKPQVFVGWWKTGS